MGRSFDLEDIAPLIARVIEIHSGNSSDYITHEEMVDSLMRRDEAAPLIERAYVRAKAEQSDSSSWTRQQWADNMVAPFSQKFPGTRWSFRFEREKERAEIGHTASKNEPRPEQAGSLLAILEK